MYCVAYDKLLWEYGIGLDADSFSLPPDGYLRYESDEKINVTYMEGDSVCKLEMSGVGDTGKNYSRNMVWTGNGNLYQTIKMGEEEDIRVFHMILLDSWLSMMTTR